MDIHATGTGGLVAPLALCLGPPGKKIPKITPIVSYGNHPIKKVLEKIFGCGKMFVMPGVGHAPRATSQIPGTAGSSVHYGSVMLL